MYMHNGQNYVNQRQFGERSTLIQARVHTIVQSYIQYIIPIACIAHNKKKFNMRMVNLFLLCSIRSDQLAAIIWNKKEVK